MNDWPQFTGLQEIVFGVIQLVHSIILGGTFSALQLPWLLEQHYSLKYLFFAVTVIGDLWCLHCYSSRTARDLTTHVRLSSHRVGLSPKSQSHSEGGHALKDVTTRQSSRRASEVGPEASNMQGQTKTRSCESTHDNTAQHEPSLTLAAWVSQGTQEAGTLKVTSKHLHASLKCPS